MRRRPGLTMRQAEVLSAVRGWVAAHGYPPSARELARVIGTGHQGAALALGVLEGKGCLHRAGRRGCRQAHRTLVLVAPAAGPQAVHLASATVAHEDGAPAGVAYRITSAECGGAV